MNNKAISVWAFQHVGYEDLGSLENILNEINADIRYVCGKREDLKALDPAEPDLIIILGGPMGVYETDSYPYLLDEIEIARRRIELGLPMLGICLGSQVIARALGASVYKGRQGKEIGWHRITVNEAGQNSPVRHLDGALTNMMHWHGDTFDLPEGAVRLASSATYENQAYKYGDHVLAVQCHPEVTPRKLGRWYDSAGNELDEVPGLTVDKLKADADLYGQTLREQAKLFFLEWAEGALHIALTSKAQNSKTKEPQPA